MNYMHVNVLTVLELPSFIISIVGCALSLAGILATLYLAGRATKIEKELKTKLKSDLNRNHYSENKANYKNDLKNVEKRISKNPTQVLEYDCWSMLDSTLRNIKADVESLKNESLKGVIPLIDNTLEVISKQQCASPSDIEKSNKGITATIHELLAYLEKDVSLGE